MDIFEAFATDETKELEGVELPMGDGFITVARAYNDRHGKYFSKRVEAEKRLLDSKTPEADAKSTEIVIDSMAKFVFLSFRGLSYQKQPLEDTYENRVKLLKVKDFRRIVNERANDMTNYLIYQEDQDAKNSPTS